VDYLKNWITPRLDWLDDQSMRSGRIAYRPPVLSHNGGPISTSLQLTMELFSRSNALTTYATGDIYYTLDNSDPRLPGGEISATSLKYSAPLTIQSSVTVRARLYSQRNWSPLATSTFFFNTLPANATNLVISEIMYRPSPPTTAEIAAGIVDAESFEYFELRNIANQAIDLTGVKVIDGVDFDFAFVPASARLLKPGESMVLVADKRAFSIRYPYVADSKILGQFRGHLDSGGETIAIQAGNGSMITQFRYDDDRPWPSTGGGGGRSLMLLDPATNPNPADPSHWILSAREGGTPGESGTGAEIFSGDPSKDTDGDGLTDFFEFASGSDAVNPGSGFLPVAAIASVNVNGITADYFTFAFHRRTDVRGTKFTLETSTDLRTWVPSVSTLILFASRLNPDGTVTDNYRGTAPVLNSPSQAFFLRLKVEPE
jgi:hypothetical protein